MRRQRWRRAGCLGYGAVKFGGMGAGKRHNGHPGGNRAIGDSAACCRHTNSAVRIQNHAVRCTGSNLGNGALVVQPIGGKFFMRGLHRLNRKIKLTSLGKARHDLGNFCAIATKQFEQQPLEIAGHLNIH